MIQIRFIISLLFLIALFGTASFFSVLWYVDPYTHKDYALILITISFFLMILGIVSLVLFFIKKVFFRWDIELTHIISSMRQASFFGIYSILLSVGIYIGISLFVPIIVLFFMLVFLELFFQTRV